MKTLKSILILSLLLAFSTHIEAQMFNGIVKGMLVEVETKDGMNLIGNVAQVNSESITLEYEVYGELTMDTQWIKSIKQIENETIKEDGYWHENRNYSRNFYGPTGMGLEKGKGYYQNIELVWNHLAYAFTDYFTLGIDFEIVSILARLSGEEPWDSPLPVTALTPKFSFSATKDVHIGIGSIFLLVPSTDYFVDGGIAYAVGTIGDKNRNATLGFGIPFIEGEIEARSPIVTLSGQYRLNKRIALVSENWMIFPEGEDNTIFVGVQGMRYLARKLTWDFGLGLFAGGGIGLNFVPLPYISVVFPFERN